MRIKPHYQVPIQECGEPLVPLPAGVFALEEPHPYMKLGAPYGEQSPYFLRTQVLERLIQAQTHLQTQQPGWKIQIFDAYRPIAVQQFMVDYTCADMARAQGFVWEDMTEAQQQELLTLVYQFWALPSTDPRTPPPHSTGAAVDVSLVDQQGQPVDMGSTIDEVSERSHPNYFAVNPQPDRLSDDHVRQFHTNRQQLKQVMVQAGFCQHPNEWWHFSFNDQLWVWLMNQHKDNPRMAAVYGAI